MHNSEDNRDLNILEELGYEPTDVETRSIPKVTIIFFVVSTVMFIIAWGVMSVIDRTSVTTPDPAKFSRRRSPEGDAPLLQTNKSAKMDTIQLRREELAKTETFAWVDESKGIVRVPIEVGMQKLLEQGVLTRPNAGTPEERQ